MVWYIIKTWKELISNKKVVLMTSVFLFLTIFSLFMVDGEEEEKKTNQTVSLGVVDNDQSIYSNLIVEYFKNIESFSDFATLHIGTEEEIEQQFDDGKLLGYLVVPEGFADNLMQVKNVPIKAVINTNNTSMAIMFRNLLESYEEYIESVQLNAVALYDLFKAGGMERNQLNKMNMETSIELVLVALDRESLFEKEEVEDMPHTSLTRYYVWAILSLVIVFSSLMSGALYLKERACGTYERLRIIGHSIVSVLGAILISNIVIWSFLAAVAICFITNTLKIAVTYEFYVFIICCIILTNMISCLVASFCKDQKSFMIIGNLGLLLMAIVGGVAIPLTFVPKRFLDISKMTPNYYMISYSIKYSNGIVPIQLSHLIAITVIGTAIIFTATCFALNRSKKFRVGGEYAAI